MYYNGDFDQVDTFNKLNSQNSLFNKMESFTSLDLEQDWNTTEIPMEFPVSTNQTENFYNYTISPHQSSEVSQNFTDKLINCQSTLNNMITDNQTQDTWVSNTDNYLSPNYNFQSNKIIGKTKRWQQALTLDLRNELTNKLFRSTMQTENPQTWLDKRTASLYGLAKKLELRMYENANSREEYYKLMEDKSKTIHQELVDFFKSHQQKQLTTSNNVSVNPNVSSQNYTKGILTVHNSQTPLTSNLASTSNLTSKIQESHNARQTTSLNSDIIPSANQQPGTTLEPKQITFKPRILREVLMPILEVLYRQYPESVAFREPVDPVALNIPDYPQIITNPMDLSTIKRKLDLGEYREPWEFINDIRLVFTNAWLYNGKNTNIYRYSTKLYNMFESRIDEPMQSLGYCCGRNYVFNPQVLCCYGKQLCVIRKDAEYWNYQNKYTYCQNCFAAIPGVTVIIGEEASQSFIVIEKTRFVKTRNDVVSYERYVNCVLCRRKMHEICVLYVENIWPTGFICENCLKTRGMKRRKNTFRAKALPRSNLGTYIENRVNNFLKENGNEAAEVIIRVLSNCDKTMVVKPGAKKKFVDKGEFPEKFHYRAKALFAYQEIDGKDICIFGMHVQEYGSECPQPNTRRVNIAYLDSVHFFQPKELRTAVYHEILLGYLDYVKQLGYHTAHIWACPPSEGSDYIFHFHPPEQKIPKIRRLQDWYKKMLAKGIFEKILIGYKDILSQFIADDVSTVTQMPYFEGDFWPNVVEESIKKLDEMEAEEKGSKDEISDVDNKVNKSTKPKDKKKEKGKPKNSNKNKPSQKKNLKNKKIKLDGNELSAHVYSAVEKYKQVFFVVRLHEPEDVENFPAIHDPDSVIICDLMDGRDAFLHFSRERHLEFSSLRRAKYSTMTMLYELHNQGQDRYVYTCNNCKNQIYVRYHCTVCEDYDLCFACFEKIGHSHKMDKFDYDIETSNEKQAPNPRKSSIKRSMVSVKHASQCRDANCLLPHCLKMRRIIQHTKICKEGPKCPVCKQFLLLCCLHSKNCQEDKCLVPHCRQIKMKRRQQQLQESVQQNHLLRRRMASMTSKVVANKQMQRNFPTLHSTGKIIRSAKPQIVQGKSAITNFQNISTKYSQSEKYNNSKSNVLQSKSLNSIVPSSKSQSQMQNDSFFQENNNVPQSNCEVPPQTEFTPYVNVQPSSGNSSQISLAVLKLKNAFRKPKSPEQLQEVLNILNANPLLMVAYIKQRFVEKGEQEKSISSGPQEFSSGEDTPTQSRLENNDPVSFAFQYLLKTIKSTKTPQEQAEVLNLLNSSPNLVHWFISQEITRMKLQRQSIQNK